MSIADANTLELQAEVERLRTSLAGCTKALEQSNVAMFDIRVERDALQDKLTAIELQKPAEDFCYCGPDVSLQMVSGGGAPEGYLGKVTLRIGDKLKDYLPSAEPAQSIAVQEPEPLCEDEGCPQHGTVHICIKKE